MEFDRITQTNGQYAVQGHSKSLILVPFGSCDFLLVNSTNLYLVLYHFQVIADYWSNFCFW